MGKEGTFGAHASLQLRGSFFAGVCCFLFAIAAAAAPLGMDESFSAGEAARTSLPATHAYSTHSLPTHATQPAFWGLLRQSVSLTAHYMGNPEKNASDLELLRSINKTLSKELDHEDKALNT